MKLTMRIEFLILNKLLDKFEKSSHYRGTSLSNRRVIIKLGSRSLDLKEYDIDLDKFINDSEKVDFMDLFLINHILK